MKSVGELLHRQREAAHLTIAALSTQTKIKEAYIESIEKNAFADLPSPVAAQGYVATLATALGLQPESMLALLRRDYLHVQEQGYPLSVVERKKSQRRRAVINAVFSLIAIIGIICAGYGFWTYQRVRQAPNLQVISPKSEEKVISPVVVRGTTTSDAVIEVDGLAVGVSQDGEFLTQEELLPGPHVITVTAKNRYGKTTVEQVMVTVEK